MSLAPQNPSIESYSFYTIYLNGSATVFGLELIQQGCLGQSDLRCSKVTDCKIISLWYRRLNDRQRSGSCNDIRSSSRCFTCSYSVVLNYDLNIPLYLTSPLWNEFLLSPWSDSTDSFFTLKYFTFNNLQLNVNLSRGLHWEEILHATILILECQLMVRNLN